MVDEPSDTKKMSNGDNNSIVAWLCRDPDMLRMTQYGQAALQNIKWWLCMTIMLCVIMMAIQFVLTNTILYYVYKMNKECVTHVCRRY